MESNKYFNSSFHDIQKNKEEIKQLKQLIEQKQKDIYELEKCKKTT
jgi:hypothetical protein